MTMRASITTPLDGDTVAPSTRPAAPLVADMSGVKIPPVTGTGAQLSGRPGAHNSVVPPLTGEPIQQPGGTDLPKAAPRAVSRPQVGEVVLVKIDDTQRRPMLVTRAALTEIFAKTADREATQEFRLSGTIFCEPEDHTAPAFRGAVDKLNDPAKIWGRPDRMLPLGYAEYLGEGGGVGQWIPRALNLPAGR